MAICLLEDFGKVLATGIGATVVLDLWLLLLLHLGVPFMNMALLGRWIGNLARGRLRHAAIGREPPVRGELALGWFSHYLIGVAFAAVLVAVQGVGWLARPSLPPALAVGVGTVLAPLFVLHPAMGLGVLASKTPTPWRNCLRSLVNHAMFGCGLFLSASALA